MQAMSERTGINKDFFDTIRLRNSWEQASNINRHSRFAIEFCIQSQYRLSVFQLYN